MKAEISPTTTYSKWDRSKRGLTIQVRIHMINIVLSQWPPNSRLPESNETALCSILR